MSQRASCTQKASNAERKGAAEPARKFGKLYEVYSTGLQPRDFDEGEAFRPEVLPLAYLTDPQPHHSFVYVCTIQRMAVNLFGRQAVFSGEADKMRTSPVLFPQAS